MNWIKDPANRIYVVTIGILLIVAIAGAAYMFTSKEETPMVQDNPISQPDEFAPGTAPQPINVQPAPTQPNAAAQPAQVVQAGPMEPWRSDRSCK